MKNNLLPWHLLTLAALVAPSLYLAYAWPALPAQVPTHFGFDGRANGYTSRAGLWLLTLALPLGVALLFTALPRLDPKRRLDGASANFQKLRLALVGLLSGLACYVLYLALHPGTPPGRGLAVLLGIFLVGMGNYLTTVQPNYFVGIRTPWTLENPTVWARTHRVGGVAFCVAGGLMVALALMLPPTFAEAVLLGGTVGTSVFCYGYSYYVFRQEEAARPA